MGIKTTPSAPAGLNRPRSIGGGWVDVVLFLILVIFDHLYFLMLVFFFHGTRISLFDHGGVIVIFLTPRGYVMFLTTLRFHHCAPCGGIPTAWAWYRVYVTTVPGTIRVRIPYYTAGVCIPRGGEFRGVVKNTKSGKSLKVGK